MIIAIDAMGGDNAPKIVVEGALAAAKEWKDVDIILVGNSAAIEHCFLHPPSEFGYHAEEVI